MPEFTLTITGITIVSGRGPDKCMIHTTLPGAMAPHDYREMLVILAAKDEGEAYVKANFPDIEYKLVCAVSKT